jgi:hypothetical protein
VSFGTEIDSLSDFSEEDSFWIKYKNGDLCNLEKEIRFSSKIIYTCDPTVDVGTPVLIS